MRRRVRNKYLLTDTLLTLSVLANTAHLASDYEYWTPAPSPLYFFLLCQLPLLLLLLRVPLTRYSYRCIQRSLSFLLLLLIANTTIGTYWLT